MGRQGVLRWQQTHVLGVQGKGPSTLGIFAASQASRTCKASSWGCLSIVPYAHGLIGAVHWRCAHVWGKAPASPHFGPSGVAQRQRAGPRMEILPAIPKRTEPESGACVADKCFHTCVSGKFSESAVPFRFVYKPNGDCFDVPIPHSLSLFSVPLEGMQFTEARPSISPLTIPYRLRPP